MQFYRTTAQEALRTLESDAANGLQPEQVAAHREKYGKNEFTRAKRKSLLRRVWEAATEPMLILLFFAWLITIAVNIVNVTQGEHFDYYECVGILVAIAISVVLTVVMEGRSAKAFEELNKIKEGVEIKVVRGGVVQYVPQNELVAGDVVYLETGNKVAADGRLIECVSLACDESSLTGESAPVEKSASAVFDRDLPVAERTNMVYSGCFVTGGTGKMVVTGVGDNTEFGLIAREIQRGGEGQTPLQEKMGRLGKVITVIGAVCAALIFLIQLVVILVRGTASFESISGVFIDSIVLMVAAVPEGLPTIMAISLSINIAKMARQNALVKKMVACETVGCVNVICSDKTGTLTENRMTVEEIVTDFAGEGEIAAQAFSPADGRKLCECMLICNTVRPRGGKLFGDPTEVALVRYVQGKEFAEGYKKLGSLPFDSDRKMMTVAAATEEGKFNFTKGAADVLVRRCDRILAGGAVRAMTERDREAVLRATARLSSRALRVLGFAYGEFRGRPEERDLIFVGLCGMIDPPRAGVKEAVAACRTAGILPVMITGDHRDTAFAIARRLGIAEQESEVVTGAELDAMSEGELAARVPQGRVFARVSPRHKRMIVERFQKAGHVVAMTGDGINDAPGIRKADIGIAMGVSGTDVTKSAADMVIADDNFSTIVTAVREGRHVFSNVKKTIQFFLATNLAEVLAILIVSLALYSCDFLTSTQLLWINLITDSLPVLSLGAEIAERDVMTRPPSRAADLFSLPSLRSVIVYGVLQAAVCIGTFVFCLHAYGNAVAVTVTFFVLSFLELFHSFNIRSERSSAFGRDFFKNRMLFVTVAVGVAVNLLLCLFAPLRAAFGIVPLTAGQWALVFGASAAIVPLAEAYKWCVRRAGRRAGPARERTRRRVAKNAERAVSRS